jgi:glutamate N-acetyltransferase/amino-acid N-acetyltransferase
VAVAAPVNTVPTPGVCAPLGYRAGAAAADVRGHGDTTRLDIALLRSEPLASAAGVFTRNVVKAAPVVISQLTLRRGTPVGGVVLNAGNANACTGAQGFRDALRMCASAAEVLDLDPSEVLVCSTGVIGRPLPVARVAAGIRAAGALDDTTGDAVARAILTTDRRPKVAMATVDQGGVRHIVGGMAKGSGMLHPDLATLLAVITTDAAVPTAVLQPLLQRVADATFNCVTVDGDTSTNDSVILLANGAAGGPALDGGPGLAALEGAVLDVCDSLAEQLVADAEGAERYFRVAVSSAADDAQARRAARVVAQSPLVKSAVHGGDPNWGRVVAALGRSGASFTLDRCRVDIGGFTVFERGAPALVDLDEVGRELRKRRVDMTIDLGAGDGAGHAWGCELTAEYVHINADYTT